MSTAVRVYVKYSGKYGYMVVTDSGFKYSGKYGYMVVTDTGIDYDKVERKGTWRPLIEAAGL